MHKKLGPRQRSLMIEAARRWLQETRYLYVDTVEARAAFTAANQEKRMVEAWTGVGTKSEYRTVVNGGLMAINLGCRHRSTRWFRMTEKGAALVQRWIHAGLHLGHFDGYQPTYHVDEIIESCLQKEREQSCTR